MPKLEIIVKITDNKGIQVGRTVYLFNKPRVVVGFWNNSLVFATDNLKQCLRLKRSFIPLMNSKNSIKKVACRD